MAETGWLEGNDLRSYPLVQGNFALVGGGELPRKGLVDAGFMPGIDSCFEVGKDTVFLHSMVVGLTKVTFTFRAGYSEPERDFLRCYEWVFTFNYTDPFGLTQHRDMTLREGFSPPQEPDRGQGFLTVGDLSEIEAFGLGEYVLAAEPEVEPALIQPLAKAFVKNVNIANAGRPCPPGCPCPPSSSSSSSSPSSSSSSSSGCVDPDPIEPDTDSHAKVLPETVGLIGDVKLKPGFNSQIVVVESSNLIQLRAGVKLGEGEPCEDLRVDDEGRVAPNLCLPCAGPIYAINGVGADVADFQLVGGPGVVITPNPDEHEIVISLDEEGICEVDI